MWTLPLPFSSTISCAIFEEIAMLVHWIFEQKIAVHFVYYLDNYLWVHKHYAVCLSTCHALQAVAKDIGLPLAPSKLYGQHNPWTSWDLQLTPSGWQWPYQLTKWNGFYKTSKNSCKCLSAKLRQFRHQQDASTLSPGQYHMAALSPEKCMT